MESKSYSVDFGGRPLTAEFTDLAGQANGSVILRYGETVILVTAVMSGREAQGLSYFPLSVEFEEKFYAAGQILGSRFVRREGRPTDEAVLAARVTDRTIRPLFDHALRNEVQVVISVLSLGADDPDTLGVIGASLALSTSDIPWNGPVGAVRIGKRSATGELVVNPTYAEREAGALSIELLACGKDGKINMIETGADEADEGEIVAMLEAASKAHAVLEAFQKDIAAELGKEKRPAPERAAPPELQALFDEVVAPKLSAAVFCGAPGKASIHATKDAWITAVKERVPGADAERASAMYEEAVDAELHRGTVEEGRRPDGRGLDELRPLFAKAGGLSPVLHGSGIFYRGETHIFTALTLGGPEDSQLIDTMEERDMKKRFMHHYNFPPFSVGEAGRVGGFNRRMIGHGALAEKALAPVIPPKETFPYTIRLVSETMSSNGSSSMGSVCASTLALMDGGVPIKKPVAGIASGVMLRGERYALLTDIQGPEDEHGDMDFKVAGTRDGVTAIQMDVKVEGIPVPLLAEALEKAREARRAILEVIERELAAPRADISPRAPKIISLAILPEQIGLVIGSGGKTINGIKDATGVDEITIEDDGTVFITGKTGAAEAARERILALTRIFETGEKLDAEITRIAPFGAFAKLNDHAEGLIHISEIVPWRIEKVEDALAVGEHVPVVVTKVEDGKIGLSIKQADPDFGAQKGLRPPARTQQ
jgi:polyribonucleotide nucleotidyltransferase